MTSIRRDLARLAGRGSGESDEAEEAVRVVSLRSGAGQLWSELEVCTNLASDTIESSPELVKPLLKRLVFGLIANLRQEVFDCGVSLFCLRQ